MNISGNFEFRVVNVPFFSKKISNIYIYIYIYMKRERKRDRERDRDRRTDKEGENMYFPVI